MDSETSPDTANTTSSPAKMPRRLPGLCLGLAGFLLPALVLGWAWQTGFLGRDALLVGLGGLALFWGSWLIMSRRGQLRGAGAPFFRLVVESSSEVFFRTDTNGNLTYLNPAWEGTTGFTPADSIGRNILEFVFPEDKDQFLAHLAPLAAGEEPAAQGEFRLVTSQQSYRWVELVVRTFGQTHCGVTGWTGTIRNITAKRLAEEALRENEERYRRIFQNIQDVYFETSLGGIIVEISPSVEHLCGFRRDQLIGRTLYAITGEKADADRVKESLLSNHLLMDHEIQVRSREGGLTSCSVNARLVFDGEGKPLKIIGSMRDMTERKRAESRIRQLAYHDTLTGLPNRSLFKDRLDQTLAQSRRNNRLAALLFLDLDRFKDVNDSLGHASGDLLLKAVAQRLTSCIRQSDTVARLGGDEFVILLTSISSDRDVSVVADKIMESFASPIDLDGQEIYTSTSMGIVLYPHDGYDAQTLLKHADMAMYVAKERGRNAYQFFSEEMNRKAVDRHQLEAKLRKGIEQNEFSLYYQPQWDMRTHTLVGVEALLRWHHPEDGIISPNRFIPVAEETGLIRPLGEWVLRTACAQNRIWQNMGLPRLRMGVNLSGRQFRQPDLVSMIDRILAQTGLAAEYLELELTEGYLMDDAQAALRTLEFLKVRGINLAIDDFGTGYSSLNYLKNFPIDRIKIDQSFVRDVTTSRDDAAIVETIIAMARSLDLGVIAEGVETTEQLKFLTGHSCFEMQGYFFAQPMPAEEMTAYLKEGYDRQQLTREHHGRSRAVELRVVSEPLQSYS